MKKQPIYRQGDVLVERIDSIPASAIKQNCQKVVLALGEVTGHHHHINHGAILYTDPVTHVSYCEIVEALAMLEHEEHATIPITHGHYRVTIQREYHPEAIRNVAD